MAIPQLLTPSVPMVSPCSLQKDGHLVLYQKDPWKAVWESNFWYWQFWYLDDHRYIPYTAILEVGVRGKLCVVVVERMGGGVW